MAINNSDDPFYYDPSTEVITQPATRFTYDDIQTAFNDGNLYDMLDLDEDIAMSHAGRIASAGHDIVVYVGYAIYRGDVYTSLNPTPSYDRDTDTSHYYIIPLVNSVGESYKDSYGETVTIVSGTNEFFTSGKDEVDFNNITSVQQQAIAAGAQPPYNGHGGNDTVILPDTNHYTDSVGNGSSLNWKDNTVFATGSNDKNDTATIHIGGTEKHYTGDGAYNVTLGAGSDTVNMAGSGSVTVAGGAGAATINLSGTGTTVLNVGQGTDTLSVKSLASTGKAAINFTGSNQTVVISNGNGTLGNLSIAGFQGGDQIAFQGLANLTTSAA